MGEQTKIQWCDHTFNPWMGCAKVHAGCTNCYAEHALPVAMRPGGRLQWGEAWQGGQRVVKADSGWKEPMKWAREAARAGERRRVFCSSLADVLEVPADAPESLRDGGTAARHVAEARDQLSAARERLWDTIRHTSGACLSCGGNPYVCPHGSAYYGTLPGLDWLLLTKRPENWVLVPEDVRPLVWLGTSISDQTTADEWVPRLLASQGFRYRFLSLEPMVGPVDLTRIGAFRGEPLSSLEEVVGHVERPRIDWVIVGGESGSKARPLNVAWVRDIVKQCAAAGVPCFVKQLGALVRGETAADHHYPFNHGKFYGDDLRLTLSDKKGGNMEEWPEDIRVRELPHAP